MSDIVIVAAMCRVCGEEPAGERRLRQIEPRAPGNVERGIKIL